MRVLVIPEDSRRDKGLLKPLIEALMTAVGRPRAKVRVCEKPGKALLGEHAIEEVEVWVLAGHELPAEWSFRAIRAERDPKEAFFVPFLTKHRRLTDDTAGRALVAAEAARNFQRICDRCPEDMKRLTERVRALVEA